MFKFPLKGKKARIWLGLAMAVLILIIYFAWNRDTGPKYEYMTISLGELVQEVSVTGKIKPAQSVDLQFESSGRISSINYKSGDKVAVGATITSLENQDLQATVISAKADLEKTIRDFNSLNDSTVSSALRVEFENAKTNLDQVIKRADADLASDYTNALNVMHEAVAQVNTSSAILEYLRQTYFESDQTANSVNYLTNIAIQQTQTDVNSSMSRVATFSSKVSQSGGIITLGLYTEMNASLSDLSGACQSLRDIYTYIQARVQANPDDLVSSSTDRTSINTQASSISASLSAVLSAIRAITDQKITNERSVADANAKLATAQASFPTSEDILKKQSVLLSAQSQLRKTLIVAPFAGMISKINVERGQTVSSATPIVSLISVSNYQIEASITEIDVAKISTGNGAVLTLDAYGSGRTFKAVVSQVDTGATIIEGVTTYKTTLDFEGGDLADIRPDMTANIDIQTQKLENVIAIPQRAIISRNGNKIVRVSRNGLIEEQVVTVGLSGKDGMVEIASGLTEGQTIVTFVNE